MLPAFVFSLSILLVRLHQFSMPMTDVYWSAATDTTTLSDLFSYWKAIAIIFAAILSIIVLTFGYFSGSICFKRSFLYIPASVYAVFVLVSLAFSKYKYFALRGTSEHFEGTFVLLAYIIMVFFLANVVDSERRLKYIVFCVLGAALLISILGVTQATGHDFFSTATGQKLMTPNTTQSNGIKNWDMIDILIATGQKVYDFSFTDGEVYQTVYNINYVPFYLSLLIPLSAFVFIALETSDSKTKRGLSVVFLALYGLYLYNFFAANSASGYFGLASIFVVILIVFRKHLKKWIKPIICLVVVLGLVMCLLSDRWLPDIRSLLGNTASKLVALVYADNELDVQLQYDNEPGMTWHEIDYIETNENNLIFALNGDGIVFTRDDENSSFVITDLGGNQLYLRAIDSEEGVFEVLDERFHDYVKVSLGKDDSGFRILITTRAYTWVFPYSDNGFVYKNRVGKIVPLTKIEHASLIKNYRWGSNRGLIWDTTIPLLKKYVIKGAGADAFVFEYPQNDYATTYSFAKYAALVGVTDKAHNLYLQYWVNTGLISLLAWLTLVGYYLVGAVKSFRKRGFVEFSDFVNGGIFCGIIGFLFVAFFNDGSVNTMPMFYTMLGTGLAINMKDKWMKNDDTGIEKEAIMPEV